MNGLKNRDEKDLTNCQIFFYFPAGCLGRRRMIGPHAPRPSLPDGGEALVGISWTRPASVPSGAGHVQGVPFRHGGGRGGAVIGAPLPLAVRPARALPRRRPGGKVLPGRGTR